MSERNIVDEWLQIAYEDYDAALYLFDHKHPKPLEIICYHCQQSVEKSLKAYLCANGAEIQKTHEIGLLCRRCIRYDNAFSDLADNCEELEVYATGTRYPSRVEIESRDAEKALQQALVIFKFVTERVKLLFPSAKFPDFGVDTTGFSFSRDDANER